MVPYVLLAGTTTLFPFSPYTSLIITNIEISVHDIFLSLNVIVVFLTKIVAKLIATRRQLGSRIYCGETAESTHK